MELNHGLRDAQNVCALTKVGTVLKADVASSLNTSYIILVSSGWGETLDQFFFFHFGNLCLIISVTSYFELSIRSRGDFDRNHENNYLCKYLNTRESLIYEYH